MLSGNEEKEQYVVQDVPRFQRRIYSDTPIIPRP